MSKNDEFPNFGRIAAHQKNVIESLKKNIRDLEKRLTDLSQEVSQWMKKHDDEKQRADEAYKLWRKAINYSDKLADQLQNNIRDWKDVKERNDNLKDELECFRNGYKGSCYACEPVGLLNQKFSKENQKLKEALSSISARHLDVEQIKNLTHEQALEVVQNDTLIARKALK